MLEDGFKLFTASKPTCIHPAGQTKVRQRPSPELITITVAGTHHVNKHRDHEAGGCTWFENRDNHNLTIKLSEELATPGAGEAGALLTVINTLPLDTPLQLTLKSSGLRKALTTNLQRLKDTNWITHPHDRILRAIVVRLRARSTLISFAEWNRDTPKHISDEITSLSKASLLKENHDHVPTDINEPLELTSIKLTASSQKLFYLSIRQAQHSAKERRRTVMNMALTQYAVHDISGKMPLWEKV